MDRWVSRLLLAFLLAAFVAPPAGRAQTYPNRPVRLVVPFPPGGPADALGRALADQLNRMWGQPVIIENRGGAGGNLGAEVVARAAPDGYTLLLNASSHVINASLYDKLPYDPIRDFTPVSEVASYMLVLVVHPSLPATSVKDFVVAATAKPDGLSVANAGLGTPTHLAAVLFAQASGANLIHVPYRGAAPASTDLIAGQVPAMFNNPVNAVPQVKSGNLRALAVTGAKRLSLLPDVPTIAESGYPGFETRTWYGLFGPAGMPADIVRKLYADTDKVMRMPEVANNLIAQGWDIAVSPPDQFSIVLQAELDRWSAVVKRAGIKAN
ncbi:MAG: tripartite tricarboxylate transporter substrate binding protein [Alphaproteobacteria bacterium]